MANSSSPLFRYLLLLSPLIVSEEDRWWENLGIYNNLYDTLIAETFEQREARFFGEAENLKSLACRSELVLNDSERNMNRSALAGRKPRLGERRASRTPHPAR